MKLNHAETVNMFFQMQTLPTFTTERTYKNVKTCEIDELSHVSESARYRNKLYKRTRYEECT